VDWNLVGLALVLFSMGVVVGPRVVERNIKFLLAYPLWFAHALERYLQKQPSFVKVFCLIFCFNAFSLFVSVVAGFTGVLPFLFAFFTGLHVAIITYRMGGRIGLLTVFFNPVALFELPAAWIALSLGMNLGLEVLNPMFAMSPVQFFKLLLHVYLFLVLPLLFISGLIEAAIITLAGKHRPDG
jgi:uncharacterized membrane protein SpoIIM required for sporulation